MGRTFDKRILGLAGLILLVALGVWLAMSRPDAAADGKIPLTMTIPAGEETDRYYRAAVAEFEAEHPECKVKLIAIGGDYYRKVLVMIAGNVAPDLMWMGQSFAEFADRDVFRDISGFVEEEKLNLGEYEPVMLDGFRRGTKLYALPFGMDFSFLVYNRDLFRAAGLPFPQDDWSYEQFLDTAQKLTLRGADGIATQYGYKGGLDFGLFGASIFDPATGLVSCNTPEMINFFQTNLDLVYRYRVSDSPEEAKLHGLDPLGYFGRKRVAMMAFFTWNLPQMREAFAGIDWAMTLHPRVKRQSQWGSSHAICIAKDTRHPALAWALAKKFQAREFQMAMAVRMLPARRSVADEFLRNSPLSGERHLDVLAKCRSLVQPTARIPHLQELNAVFGRSSDRIWARQLTPEQGMAECERELQRRLDKFARDRARRGEQ